MAAPVTTRSTSAGASESTHSASAAFAAAPSSAPPAMIERGDQTSGRLPSALTSVPAMKPSCTAMTRPALPAAPRPHACCSAGSTAEALNQRLSARSSASEALEVGPADGAAEVGPQPRLGAADGQELAVARLVDRIVRIRAAEEALAAPWCPAVGEEEAHVRRGREQRHRRVE